MGAVYLARHRHLQRAAAIKVLLPELSSNPDVVERFFNEARATARIRHPGIVEVFDCDVLPGGRAYIVMEFLQGESLGGHLSRARRLFPDMNSIAAITAMIAEALAAAHAQGIAHRDLKPDNVFLAHDPKSPGPFVVKILDFGIAKLLAGREEGSSKTRTGSLLGTPIYMSPEQCRGHGRVDHRSDIYSLGCILFEMICGRPPFVREWPGDLMIAHVSEAPPAVSSIEPEAPPEIDALVARMLAKDPADRPQAAEEIVETMARFLGVRRSQLPGTATLAAGPPAWGATVAIPTPVPAALKTTPFPAAPTTPPRDTTFTSAVREGQQSALTLFERRKGVLTLVAAALMLAAGWGAYSLLSERPHRRSASPPPPPVTAPVIEPPAPPPPPAEIAFTVQSLPTDAEVLVGGEPMGRTPVSIKLPRAEREVELVVRAPGYKEARRTLRTDRDRDLELTLAAEPRPEPARPAVHKSSKKPQPKPQPRSPDVPFAPVGD
jgi:serine/threonine-protein kinase